MTQSFEQETETQTQDFQYVPPGALSQVEAASINQAIVSAHRFPRNMDRVRKKMKELAGSDPETAAECFYELRRFSKKENKIIIIRGESIRMAEIAAASYGNVDCGSRVVELLDGFVSCQGVCHDLENGYRATVNVYQRITIPGPDGTALAAAAGCSKALRNAILTVVPRATIRAVTKFVEGVATGTTEDVEKRRIATLTAFIELGVPREKLFEYLGVRSISDIDLDKYRQMLGTLTAIKEGHTTVAEEFGPKTTKPEFPKDEGEQKPATAPRQTPETSKTEAGPTTVIPPEPADLQRSVTPKDFEQMKSQVAAQPRPERPGGRKLRRAQAEIARLQQQLEMQTAQKPQGEPAQPKAQEEGFVAVPKSQNERIMEKLGSDPKRLEAFWNQVIFWKFENAEFRDLDKLYEERRQSLIENWNSVEAAMANPIQ